MKNIFQDVISHFY